MSPPTAGKLRVAILISGAGSNMAALIDAAAADAPYEVALVMSNKPDAGGLAVAAAKGVPTVAVDHPPFGKDRDAHERAVQAELEAHHIQAIALAGYMRLLSPSLVNR